MDDPTVEPKAEALARAAAERAAALALVAGDRATELAVAQAVRDANVDRDLREHAQHLAEINGSQREMAESLRALARSSHEQAAANTAIAAHVEKQSTSRLSRRALFVSVALAVAAYLTLLALILLH